MANMQARRIVFWPTVRILVTLRKAQTLTVKELASGLEMTLNAGLA
jgi:hypothetical protein